mmetsp:Transcript_2974/g.7542  ORF Transcript_2974/g.7542 Transcript_2974/m.7542 type:complete len:220 (-) Transcript_2974:352-1011(-)
MEAYHEPPPQSCTGRFSPSSSTRGPRHRVDSFTHTLAKGSAHRFRHVTASTASEDVTVVLDGKHLQILRKEHLTTPEDSIATLIPFPSVAIRHVGTRDVLTATAQIFVRTFPTGVIAQAQPPIVELHIRWPGRSRLEQPGEQPAFLDSDIRRLVEVPAERELPTAVFVEAGRPVGQLDAFACVGAKHALRLVMGLVKKKHQALGITHAPKHIAVFPPVF